MGALEAARAALQSFSERPVRQNAKKPISAERAQFRPKGPLTAEISPYSDGKKCRNSAVRPYG